jgi:hypothetical protein
MFTDHGSVWSEACVVERNNKSFTPPMIRYYEHIGWVAMMSSAISEIPGRKQWRSSVYE